MNSFKNEHWIGVLREQDGGGRPKKYWTRTVLEEAGKCSKTWARLRGWWAIGSDGNASQMPYVPNGTKGHTTTNKWYLLQTTC